MTDSLRIAVGHGSLATYPEGGGMWAWLLQYPLGLRALGHDVLWVEVLRSVDDATDAQRVTEFIRRMARYTLAKSCVVVLCSGRVDSWSDVELRGPAADRALEFVRTADLLWNVACAVPRDLVTAFRRRVLVDTDPGHLQVSALEWSMGIEDHDAYLSVGLKMEDADCDVPRLGVGWKTFCPFVHLPMWTEQPPPGPDAPFTSVTQWNWEEMALDGRRLSLSKREAYLRYADLPLCARRNFELAANIDDLESGQRDRATLRAGGWQLSDPHVIAASLESYAGLIARSRAELCCPKPIYRELRTGWFSDRSAFYLASGRPVLAEETGFSEHLPVGEGLLAFRDRDEAIDGVGRIDGEYERHARAARALTEEYLDARKVLPRMLDACQ